LQGDTLAYARELLAAMGPERLLWASDCPFVGVESTTYQSTIDWFEQAVTDPAQRQQIGYATPTALYFMRGR
jgi:predicted TIM-barrel fold metal-dependent hydrolase